MVSDGNTLMSKELAPLSSENLGPAMLQLTEKQQRFVVTLLEQGGRNETKAYMAAFGCSAESANANAYRAKTPAVMAAIAEEAARRLRAGAILGASVMIEIAEDPMHKDRFKAAGRLLDHAGLIVATEVKHTIEDKRSNDEILRAIGRLAKDMGHELPKALKDVVDAEFVEMSDEGLGDVLA